VQAKAKENVDNYRDNNQAQPTSHRLQVIDYNCLQISCKYTDKTYSVRWVKRGKIYYKYLPNGSCFS
jgi:hypothetical protein